MERQPGRRPSENYLRLWRSRFRSLRFLCLRIFFRRHLTTLPTESSPVGRGILRAHDGRDGYRFGAMASTDFESELAPGYGVAHESAAYAP